MGRRAKWNESAGGYDTIDEVAGVIRGVKIISPNSRNRRDYPPEVLNEARSLYEGSRIYIDHDRSGKERSLRDKWGELQDVRPTSDGGLEGDLHYNRHHTMTPQLLEDARRFSKTFGLSHAAQGEETIREGRAVVTKITEVYSVDLVADPATNKGLFESEGIVKRTVKQLLEAVSASKSAKQAKFAKALMEQFTAKKFLEEMGDMDPMAAEADMSAPDGGMEGSAPEEQVDAAFKAAVMAVLDDDSMDLAGKVGKIKAILKAQEQAEAAISGSTPSGGGDGGGSEGSSEGAGAGGSGEEDKSNMSESDELKSLRAQVASLQAENTRTKTEAACKSLLESKKREVTEIRLKTMMAVAEGDRVALVESWPAISAAPTDSSGRPLRSPSIIHESTDAPIEYPKSHEDFKKALS